MIVMAIRYIGTALACLLFCCVSAPGTAESEGAALGEVCDSDDMCASGSFCDQGEYTHGVPQCVELGVCVAIPEACSSQQSQICGCDGLLYSSSCHASMSGVGTQGALGCEPPEGEFGCGLTFCKIATEYCGCDCLDSESCEESLIVAQSCSVSTGGGVELFCLRP